MSKTVFPKSFFVTGTDTNVGKTVVSAILTAGLGAHYWKPVQCGLPADADALHATGIDKQFILEERYRLAQPFSPHLAAKLDQKQIDLSDFELPQPANCKHLLVEGAGGLLVPLNDEHKVIDLIAKFDLPVLLVARSGLGTINHTLLSLEALRQRNLTILGVVMSGAKNVGNRIAIEQFGHTNILAEIDILPDFKLETLRSCFQIEFNGGLQQNAADNTQHDMASIHPDAHG